MTAQAGGDSGLCCLLCPCLAAFCLDEVGRLCIVLGGRLQLSWQLNCHPCWTLQGVHGPTTGEAGVQNSS
eukprot:4677810-Amphidinium_carterae.1